MIYSSKNYGDYRILKDTNHLNVTVEFVLTGYKTTVQRSKVRTGGIKDPYFPLFYGFGYIGVGRHIATGKYRKVYNAWVHMLERCLTDKYPAYRKCSVCAEWASYQNFAEWMTGQENYNHKNYQIDKDLKQRGFEYKVYSPSTCVMLHKNENLSMKDSVQCEFSVVSPDGELFKGLNQRAFCKEHDLQPSLFTKVLKGKRSHHKGWRLSK